MHLPNSLFSPKRRKVSELLGWIIVVCFVARGRPHLNTKDHDINHRNVLLGKVWDMPVAPFIQ